MATQEITATSGPVRSIPAVSATPNYSRPLAVVTTLFFMWGFLTCLNDILVPHLKSIFDLSYAQVMLVQFAFFSAYFLFSVPWSKVVNTDRLPEDHGRRIANHGCRGIPVRTSRIRCFVPVCS